MVSFCRAGVSRVRVGLSDFNSFTQQVLDSLGATKDDEVRRPFSLVQQANQQTSVGLVVPDQVFQLLRRSFDDRLTDAEVAACLKHSETVDPSGHCVWLDFATPGSGETRFLPP